MKSPRKNLSHTVNEAVIVEVPEIKSFLGGDAYCLIACRLVEFHHGTKRWEVELKLVNGMNWITFPLKLAQYELNMTGEIDLAHAEMWAMIEDKCKLEAEHAGIVE